MIGILAVVFMSRPTDCTDANDVNDSGAQELLDAVRPPMFHFGHRPPPSPSFPNHGIDDTLDSLGYDRW